MIELIDDGQTDIAIGPRPTHTSARVDVFGKEEMVVVAAANHPIAQMASVAHAGPGG